MGIVSKATAKSYFETGDRPSEEQFVDLIDSTMRDSMVAIATAVEGGAIGVIEIESSAAVTARAIGALGVVMLAAETTASAQGHLGAGAVGTQVFTATVTASAQDHLGLGTAALVDTGAAASEIGLNDEAFTDVASATTTDIGAATSLNVRITGTTTITGLGTVAAGIRRNVRFADALTLTHNATSLILLGTANIATAADDTAEFISLGSGNWLCLWYKKADGTPIAAALNLETELPTTSGTSKDFTGIAATVKRITIMLDNVSVSGTSSLRVQIGDSGGIETTGYSGSAGFFFNASTSTASGLSGGFDVKNTQAAQSTFGFMTLVNMSGNKWVAAWSLGGSATNTVYAGGGVKTLDGTLDRVRLTTVNGTDTFDLGAVNIMTE